MKRLYIDDERFPKTDKDWYIVRSYDEAINYIQKNGLPDYVSFDHDLGTDFGTGYDIAKWITYAVMYKLIKWNPSFTFNVHSANPVGAKNIQSRLDTLIHHMEDELVRD